MEPAQAHPSAGWRLVWSDEFDGTSLDENKWSAVEKQADIACYTSRPVNVSVSGGYLKLTAVNDSFKTPDGTVHPYTSGYITTKAHADWTYGAFEIRAKLPAAHGMHPAIWMMPADNVYGPWPQSGEIDILESEGSSVNSVYGSLHFGSKIMTDGRAQSSEFKSNTYTLSSGDFSDGFHVFRLEWEPAEMRWYVDGVLYSTQAKWSVESHPYPAPFDQPFYLILDLAIVNYTGGPDATTPFPNTMTVDYVRVYEKN